MVEQTILIVIYLMFLAGKWNRKKDQKRYKQYLHVMAIIKFVNQ